MGKKTIPTEHEIQAAFVAQVKLDYRLHDDFYPSLLYAVVNGFWAAGSGDRRFALINKYKAEGMNSGVPDIHYDQPRGGYNKLVIEFKRADRRNDVDGGLSSEQKKYFDDSAKYCMQCVCYTADEAMKEFDYYMSLEEG